MALPPIQITPFQGINPAYNITAKGDKPDSSFIIQLNTALQSINRQVEAIIVAYNTGVAAQDTADGAQTTADGAQAGVDSLAADQYLIAAASPDLANARVATDTATVTFDFGAAGQFSIAVDALAILNLAAVVLTQDLSTTGTLHADGATTLAGGLKVTGQTETDSLRVNGTVVAGVLAPTGSVTFNISGTNIRFLTG